eukprot:12896463-Prorocentrum_lima.AAC.1
MPVQPATLLTNPSLTDRSNSPGPQSAMSSPAPSPIAGKAPPPVLGQSTGKAPPPVLGESSNAKAAP